MILENLRKNRLTHATLRCRQKTKRTFFSALMVALSICACERQPVNEIVDLPQIMERKKLVVATCSNAVDYFVYKGEPMGFHYELFTELGKHLGLKVEFLVGKSYAENVQRLADRQCDIVASELLTDNSMPATCIDTLYMERQTLVQRKPDQWKKMTAQQLEQSLMRDPENLNGKTVYVSGWSALAGGKDFAPDRQIRFVALEGVTSEGLIRSVANGELDYAICNWSEARLFDRNYDNVDLKTELGELPVGWLVRPTSVDLQQKIDQWLATFKKTTQYAVLFQKYHTGVTIQKNASNKWFANRTGVISEYDDLFRKYSAEIDWDWRLLAALVCQESRFAPDVRSRKGAYGLMQMMPATLEQFGTDTAALPERQIAAGVAYLRYLDGIIAPFVTDRDERIKFILAAYNIGPGHILDACRLAGKYGKNADVWDNNVDLYLLGKSDPKYYNDPEVRHGKCYGRETYSFVAQIMERYEHYKNIGKI